MSLVWALPLLPGLAGAILLLTGPRANRWAGWGAVVIAVAVVLLAVWAIVVRPESNVEWLMLAGEPIRIGLVADGLGAVMVLLVAAVAALVLAYSATELADDQSRWRFFGLMCLFVGGMLLLVLSADLLLLLVAWEIVGACSYALIGYWYTDPARPPAANRAFLVTRTADLGLFLATMAAFSAVGTLGLADLNRSAGGALGGGALALVTGGIIVAAAGKSAQLPFSNWLFAAMEGPSPVSALLHSATMVAAGAYLLVRLSPVIAASGWGGPVVLWLGLVTALAGALVALWQPHLKRLLAASTTSQYGYVFAAIGAGGLAGGMAHLVNHAAFKALLFLGAGVVLHRLGCVELERLGGLRRSWPWLAGLMGVGALALAAVPPLGGYFSKELILGQLALDSAAAWGLGLLIALVSAAYAARAWLVTFAGRPRSEQPQSVEVGLLWPLGVLAAGAVVAGLLALGPGRMAWVRLLGFEAPPPMHPAEALASLAAVGSGIALAWWRFRSDPLIGVPPPARALTRKLAEGWLGLTSLQDRLVVAPVLALARGLASFDVRVVDGGVRTAARVGRALAGAGRAFDLRTVDAPVAGSAATTLRFSVLSAKFDRSTLDRSIEGLAHAIWRGGGRLRGIQTGLLHEYYAMAAAGIGALIAFLILT